MTTDAQRSRVYAWEAVCGLVGEHVRLDDEDIAPYIRFIWMERGLPLEHCPAVDLPAKGSHGLHKGMGRYTRSRISLPPWCRTRPYILHELAHAITYVDSGWKRQGHGPDFVAVLIQLRVRYLDQDRRELLDNAHRMRVRVAGETWRKLALGEAAGPLVLTRDDPKIRVYLDQLLAAREFWQREMELATGVKKAHIGNRLRGINTKLGRYGCV